MQLNCIIKNLVGQVWRVMEFQEWNVSMWQDIKKPTFLNPTRVLSFNLQDI